MSGHKGVPPSLSRRKRSRNSEQNRIVDSIAQQVGQASTSTQVKPDIDGELSSQLSIVPAGIVTERSTTPNLSDLFSTPGSPIQGIPASETASILEGTSTLISPLESDHSDSSESNFYDTDLIEEIDDILEDVQALTETLQSQLPPEVSSSGSDTESESESESLEDIEEEDNFPEEQEEDQVPLDNPEEYPPQIPNEEPFHQLDMANQMIPIRDFAPNRIDTFSLRRYAFPGARLSSDMITRYINIPYFNVANDDQKVTRGIVLNMYARGRCAMEKWTVNECQRTLAALEGIAPNLPDSCFAPTPKARHLFVISALHYLAKNGSSSSYHRLENWPIVGIDPPMANAAAMTNLLSRVTDDNVNGLVTNFNTSARVILGLPAGNGDITQDLVTAMMAEALALFLEVLAKAPSNSALALSTEIYCLAYIGISKQGNITNAKLTAICNAVSEETGRAINLTTEVVRTFSNSFKPFINANNAAAICEGLNHRMSTFSLRLCITMQQAVKSGMTSYWEAISSYAGFPWVEAATHIPQDFSKYLEAVNLVGNNQYYGFNSDLGVAKHTNYLSLSWLACKVLIKCDPPSYSALAIYRGIPTHPKREEQLQALIDEYDPAEAAVNINAANMALAEIRARITAALADN